jgi:hypothetical protein
MDKKLGAALIAPLLVALLMPAGVAAQAGDPTTIDFVNIGDPTSEAEHNLYGWGPIVPDPRGGTWGGGSVDGTCRPISFFKDGSGSDWASFEMDFGDSPGTKYLLLHHMDGYADDSFYVYIDELGEPGDGTEAFYWPDKQSDEELWSTAEIPLDFTGVYTFYLLCAQPAHPDPVLDWKTYEQVAFSWASVVPAWVIDEEPMAITLVSFTAEAGVGSVTLVWETGTEVDNAGFNLYRATAPDGPWTKVNGALIAAEGDPVAGASYSFLDEDLAPGTYTYKLEDVDLNGVATLHGPVSATAMPRLRRPPYRPTLP